VAKDWELVEEVVPTTSRVGFLLEADSPGAAVRLKEYEAVARPLNLEVRSLNVQTQNPDFSAAFHSAGHERVTALITVRRCSVLSIPEADRGACHQASTLFNV
jgi:ABC-type uncharacterized transport system substrate-binding protein